MDLVERRRRMEQAAQALDGLREVVHQASGDELVDLMTLADRLETGASAARVVVTAEAVTRGEVAESGDSVHDWVCAHAPSLRQGGAGQVARLVAEVAPGGALAPPDGVAVDPDSPLGLVWSGVIDGSVSPGLATAVLRELQRLQPLLRDEARPTVVRALLDLGTRFGPAMMRRLRPRLLAEHGHSGVLDELQERLALAARLSSPFVESGDLTEYQLLMTPEQATALEAAIGPLSAPSPNDETGERDLRPAGQRRVEALTEVCRRSSGLDAADRGGADGAAGSSAAVHVVVPLSDLESRTGCGEVVGSTATGTVLSPGVLRRVCCEADLIPHVLGTAGEVLDLGRVVRLFTRAQRRLLWRRDTGCTYPGCTAPAAWTKAHHVVHWVDGGASDIDNAALLCQRHHSYVHSRRLVADVRRRPDDRGRYVVWDLTPGSYDRRVAGLGGSSGFRKAPITPARLRALARAVDDHDPDGTWPEDHGPSDRASPCAQAG